MRTDPPPLRPWEEPGTRHWPLRGGPAGLGSVPCVWFCTERGHDAVWPWGVSQPQPACDRTRDISEGLAPSTWSPPGPLGGTLTGVQAGSWASPPHRHRGLPLQRSSLRPETTRPAGGTCRCRMGPEGDVRHRGAPHLQPVTRSCCRRSSLSCILKSILYLPRE